MPDMRRRFTEAQIEAALRANHGNQSAAAKALAASTGARVNRQSIFERVKTSPRLQAVIAETNEEVIDLAEDILVQSLHRGDVNAGKFILEARGKNRGYSGRT